MPGSSLVNMMLTQAYQLEQESSPQQPLQASPTQPSIRPLPQRVERLNHSTYSTSHQTVTPPQLARQKGPQTALSSDFSTPAVAPSIPVKAKTAVTPANFALPPAPKTPRTQRVVDRVREEFKGNLPYILSKLKRTLESLLPAKDQAKRLQSSLAQPFSEHTTNLTFKCEQSGFLNAMNMVDYCQRLANKLQPPPVTPPGLTQLAADITLCMNNNMLLMEGKMSSALTEHAKTVSSSIEKLKQESHLF